MTRTHATIQLRMLAAFGDSEPTEVAVIDVPVDVSTDGGEMRVIAIHRPALRRLLRKLGRVFARTI